MRPCQAGWGCPFSGDCSVQESSASTSCACLSSVTQMQLLGTGLMRKVLAQLVASMRKLGSTVVSADLHSIILSTGKRNLTAAVGWVPTSHALCLPVCSVSACVLQQSIYYVTFCGTTT